MTSAKATTLREATTQKQLGMINAIARARGLNAYKVSEEMYQLEPHELTVAAASRLIDAMKSR